MTALLTGQRRIAKRHRANFLAGIIFALTIAIGIVFLAILLLSVLRDGWPWLDWDFITSYPSRFAQQAGIKSALWGTVWIALIVALLCFPLGIGAAIYLEEYADDNRFTRIIKLNIANLAGVPSIIYGLLGLALFTTWLSLGRSVLAGGLTMTLLTLPLVIITTQEAIRSVPLSYRQAAYALGATRWQVVSSIVLPTAMPAISTGMIFAIARAIGEAAPMIAIAALVYLTTIPTGPLSRFTVLPVQIFNWLSRPQADFHGIAAAGILVLLTTLLVLNGAAIYFRDRYQKVSEE